MSQQPSIVPAADQCAACKRATPAGLPFCLYCGRDVLAAGAATRPYVVTIAGFEAGARRRPVAELVDRLAAGSPGGPAVAASLEPDCLPARLALRADEPTAQLVLAELQRLGARAELAEDRALAVKPGQAPIYSSAAHHYFLPRLRGGAWAILGLFVLIGQVPLVVLVLLINSVLQRVTREDYERYARAVETTPAGAPWTVLLLAAFALPVFLLPFIFLLEASPLVTMALFLAGAGGIYAYAQGQRRRKRQTYGLDARAVAAYFSGFDQQTLGALRAALREIAAPRLANALSEAVQSASASVGAIRRAGVVSGNLLAPIAGKLGRMLRLLCLTLGRVQRLEHYLAGRRLPDLEAEAEELDRSLDETDDTTARDLLRQARDSKLEEVEQYQAILADRARLEAQIKALQAGFSQLHSRILKITLLDVQYRTDESGDLERKLNDLAGEVESIDQGISEMYGSTREIS